ncbi:MAG: hypothetical protein JWO54_414 [Candidatus Saccharibacteria bacterium]|nr:hypothetical protein [Candidatus Saccharibacteria bacterium]MDB5180654.1 hypothetical protein [Candidatus Saccharibacteria bacterium]
MTLSTVQFEAEFTSKLFPEGKQLYRLKVNDRFRLTVLHPVEGTFNLVRIALEAGYLSPDEAEYWRDAPPDNMYPLPLEKSKHVMEFCHTNAFLWLHGRTLKPKLNIQIGLRNHLDPEEDFILIDGVVKEITSVQSRFPGEIPTNH